MNEPDYKAFHETLNRLEHKTDKVLEKVGDLSTRVALNEAANKTHSRRIHALEIPVKSSTTSDLDRELKRKQIRFYAVLTTLVIALTGVVGTFAYRAGAAPDLEAAAKQAVDTATQTTLE